jgi:hypothetical protein
MFKVAIAGTIVASALAQVHPINEDLINEIKEKTQKWIPADPSTNPLANKSMTQIMGLLGTHI